MASAEGSMAGRSARTMCLTESLLIKKLSPHADPGFPAGLVPTRGSPLAAGFDLASAYDYVIPARGKELVKTDISIAVPEGTYGRVGLSCSH